MMLLPLNAAVIGVVALVTLALMIYWHVKTKGSWRLWPAGRSLMQLFGVILIITTNAAVNILIPLYPGKIALYFGLYLLLLAALIKIGFTIRSEMRIGQAKRQDKNPSSTGPITVTVASTNTEDPAGVAEKILEVRRGHQLSD